MLSSPSLILSWFWQHSMSIPFVNFGSSEQLPADVEEGPKDLFCYCNRCCYQRDNTERVKKNMLYGLLCPPLWVYNIALYFHARKYDSQYKFSESIEWGYKKEVTLISPLDDDSMVKCLIKEHDNTGKEYDQYCGWSAMALCVSMIILWLLWML